MRAFEGIVLLALGVGAAVGTHSSQAAKGTAEDMVAVDLSNAVPGVHHVGFTAPDAGRLIHLEWTTRVSGSGAGNAIFDVIRESDDSVLCSAVVPCGQAVGAHVHVDCDAELIRDEHLDLAPRAPACLLMPQGVIVVTFFWQ